MFSVVRLRSFGVAASLVVLAIVAGCVLNPRAEFDRWEVEYALGQSFSKRTANYCPPLSSEATDSGSIIYSYRYQCRKPNSDCTIFYEVRQDVIVAAWHEGTECSKAN